MPHGVRILLQLQSAAQTGPAKQQLSAASSSSEQLLLKDTDAGIARNK